MSQPVRQRRNQSPDFQSAIPDLGQRHRLGCAQPAYSGPVLLQNLFTQDLFLASGIILLLGMMTVIRTLLSDILLVVADPRKDIVEYVFQGP